jgi:RNA polymerase sigma factor (sigma-70 family)
VTRAANLVRQLRHLLAPPETHGAGDAELLDRFVKGGDQAAFELLVRRHEAMVFGVCRRIVGDRQDAEDVFQATFLALACKAGSIRQGEAVAGWLYRVACRGALQVRAAAQRRRRLHRLDAELDSLPAPPELRHDLAPVLDEELSQLPEKLRTPVVLCYLLGGLGDETELGAGEWRLPELARKLRVNPSKLRRWIRLGWVRARRPRATRSSTS